MPIRQFVAACLTALLMGSSAAVVAADFQNSDFIETAIARPDGNGWAGVVGLQFSADGSRAYAWERGGVVWVLDDDSPVQTPMLDISDEVGGWRDYGMLGFALDPNFVSNGYLYVYYVVDQHHLLNHGTPDYNPNDDDYFAATQGRITRYTAVLPSGDSDYGNATTVDYGSRLVLVGDAVGTGCPILHQSHGTGHIVFGTDGTLLAACGDGASYSGVDTGGAIFGSYADDGVDLGIIPPEQNVGSYRSQMLSSLNGKVIRIDPATGDGIASNPYFDAAEPRSAESRTWALGLRNPYRMSVRPNTGAHDPAEGDPGTLYIGDVGWNVWEDLHVSTTGGENFGWPLFEGMNPHNSYWDSSPENADAPNPLYGIVPGCPQFFRFRDLIQQDSQQPEDFENPCNPAESVPANIATFLHTRPALDWRHGQNFTRFAAYDANGNAQHPRLGSTAGDGTLVTGPQFPGNAATGGVWYTGDDFPGEYQNTYFMADFGGQWVKNMVFDANDRPVLARPFLSNGGGIVYVTTHPAEGSLYYISWASQIFKVEYAPGGNRLPTAVAGYDTNFGASPVTVQFTGSNSSDPENLPLSFRWNFGDGSAESTATNPQHTFSAAGADPTRFDVSLTVTDNAGATDTDWVLVSVNNTPPDVTITSPADGTLYPITSDTSYPLTASISDLEHSAGQLACEWQVVLHHNDHTHAEPIDTSCSSSAIISALGCGAETYFFRTHLTVTDAEGLSTTQTSTLYPNCGSNEAPVANDDSADVLFAGSLGIQVLQNDVDVDGFLDASSVTVDSAPSNGTAVPDPTTGRITYTHNGSATNVDSFTYTVRDNTGAVSNAALVSVTIQPVDETPPSVPQGLQAQATSATQVSLNWNASTDTGGAGIAGYRIYRDGAPTPVATVTTTSYNDNGLASATSYEYRVSAFDAASPANESAPSAPAGATTQAAPSWLNTDVGNVAATGSLSEFNGTYTIEGSGRDIWNNQDEFHFAYRPMDGDGSITARVVSIDNTHVWAKAGLMMRETLTGGSPHVSMLMSAARGEAFGFRTTANASSQDTGQQGTHAAPHWLRLERNGNVFTAYESADGQTWSQYSQTTLALPSQLFIGLAVTSHNDGTLAAGVFDNVSLNAPISAPNVTIDSPTEGETIFGDQIAVQYSISGEPGSYNHLHLTLDSLPHITIHDLTGSYTLTDVGEGPHTVTAQLVNADHTPLTNPEAQDAVNVTVTLPDTTPPSVPQNLQAQTAGSSQIALSWNASTDTGGAGVAGYRVYRNGGATAIASVSATTYTDSGLTASTFYQYTVAAFDAASPANESALSAPAGATTDVAPAWLNTDVGNVAATGSYAEANGTYTIEGSGRDIWNNQDEFHYVYKPMIGDGSITARVVSIDDTHVWAKAGLMMRDTLSGGSRHVSMLMSSARGEAFGFRTAANASSGDTGAEGTHSAPHWLRLERNGDVFTGYQSVDGQTWTQHAQTTLALPNELHVGLAVTSHDDGTLATGVIDNVTVTDSSSPADVDPPSVPQDLAATTAGPGAIDLSWSASVDAGGSGVAGYRIYRDGGATPIASVTGTSYGDSGLSANTTYAYEVSAYDLAVPANESLRSSASSATTDPAPTVTVPNVIGQTEPAAAASLTAAGFTTGTISYVEDAAAAGTVLGQSPTGGSQATAGSAVSLTVSSGPAPVAVPDVVGVSQATAESSITAAGLAVGTTTTVNHGSVPAGDVISQDPAGGTLVPAGSAVALTVSLGQATVNVPSVTGTSQASAEASLSAAGLLAGTVTDAYDPSAPAGTVISQDPVAGSVVTVGSSVDLVVSLGPEPVTVPDVVGLVQASAEAALVSAGLQVGPVSDAYDDSISAGAVLAQNPTSGSQVAPGSAVALVVSLGPEPVDETPPGIPQNLQAVADNANQVSLTWQASIDTGGTGLGGYHVYRDASPTPLATVTGTGYTDSGLTPLTAYQYTVAAFDLATPANLSAESAPASATTPAASSWLNADVGSVAAAGSYVESGGAFTIEGSGRDIWNRNDEFHFVYQPMDGDASITVRVTSLEDTHEWAKAGVMMRETLSGGSRHVTMLMSSQNGDAFGFRTSTGGGSGDAGTSGSNAVPHWLRLERNGNVFTAFVSDDGQSWTEYAQTTLALPSQIFIGLAVTSHDDGVLATAVLDNVSVTN